MSHPFVPLYVDDFEAATAHLTPEEDGLYNRLLRLSWRTPGCTLPDDDEWLARKIRVSAEVFEAVARPLLVEFFTLQRGRWVQRRLKREYDDISRKKSARKLAGKKGGEAKARNVQGKSSSIAPVLLGDTRASPEPYPEPELLLESPLPPETKLSAGDAADLIWGETPTQAKRRSSKAALQEALKAAEGRRKNLAVIRQAVAAYYADREVLRESYRWAKGVHRVVQNDFWESWAEVDHVAAEPKWGERQMRSWLTDWTAGPDGKFSWRLERGPRPDEPGCVVPAAMMAEFGLTPIVRAVR